MGKWKRACDDLYSLEANGSKDVTVLKKKVKNFIKLTKKKLRRNEIGSCHLKNAVENIYDFMEYLENLPQCKRVIKLQVSLKKLQIKLIIMKSAFQEDDNDFYQENYDTDSDYDDNEEHEDDDNDDRCHVEEEEDFYEKNYPDDIVNEDYDYYNIVRTKIRDRIKKMTMVMSTDRPTLNTS